VFLDVQDEFPPPLEFHLHEAIIFVRTSQNKVLVVVSGQNIPANHHYLLKQKESNAKMHNNAMYR